MDLLVLEEHGGHDRQVRHGLARADRRRAFLREHHGLDREEIDPALGQRGRLLLEGLEVLLVGDALVEGVVEGQAAGRPDRSRDVGRRRRRRPRQPRALLVQLAGAVADLVLVELEPGAAERVRLDDMAAGAEVARVDAPDDVGVRIVPQLGAGAVGEPGREEHGAIAPVEHERLAPADPVDDLPAARLHEATPAAAPTSALAFTTASVESLA